MSLGNWIQSTLFETFSPVFLTVENESKNHRVPEGSETHFRVVCVSSCFNGKSQVERHRWVHQLLGSAFEKGLHALSLQLLTEPEAREKQLLTTPPCIHKE